MMDSRIAEGGAKSARLTFPAYSSHAPMSTTNVMIRTSHTPVLV
jgi:hypothetical protein